MRVRQTVVPVASVSRLLGVVLLAGTAAACSSSTSRFSYQDTDQLLTASIPSSSSTSTHNIGGNPVPPGTVSGGYPQASAGGLPQAYPAAQGAVSQAFPGDYRSAAQPAYDPASGGSVARTVASPSNLLPTRMQQAAGTNRAIQPALAPPSRSASLSQSRAVVSSAPAAQPFPEQPRQLASAQPGTVYSNDSVPVMAPDQIVTGTARQDAGWTTTGATRMTLGPGETLSNLSKRYGVPVNEIMKANGIADASRVSPGQQVLIPVYVYSRQAPVSAPDSNPKTQASKSGAGLRGEAPQDKHPVPGQSPQRDVAVLPTAPTLRNPQSAEAQTGARAEPVTKKVANAEPQASGGGAYTVQGGDTLSKIARLHGVSVDAIKSANSLSGPNIRIGQSLAIPGPGAATPDRITTASINEKPEPKAYTPPVAKVEDSAAAEPQVEIASVASAATGIGKFRWPARGQVVTGFAKSENGKRNDGIDISMPTGTPVKAVENGVVIYSGDGLKEFGKTVLIRHDDGLVTVYAHANTLNVNRGDKVDRGQVIASSGMTGSARTPRLHFEVRKNASPVDPMKYLE